MNTVTYTSDRLELENVVAVLAGAGFQVERFRPVERTLLDTFDGRLHSAGVRLEVLRSVGLELRLSADGPGSAQIAVDRVPSVAGDIPAGPLRARLAPILGVRALLPVVSVTSHQARALRRNGSDKLIVDVLLEDQPRLIPDTALSLPWAAELCPLEGYPRAARQTEELLSSLGLTRRQGDLLDVAVEEAGIDRRGFVDSPTVLLDRSEPAAHAFRRVLANLADTVDRNWSGTVEDTDPEFLHDLRVAVRRTRSVLSHGKDVLHPAGRDHFRAEFRWLGTITSPARDLDVYVIEWPEYTAPLGCQSSEALAPIIDHIKNRQAAEHRVLAEQLRSARYQGLMSGWRAWLDAQGDEDAKPKKSMRPLGGVVASRLSGSQDQLLTRGRAIGPDTEAEELHELRKDAKKLRYLLECFGGVFPAAPRKAFVKRLKALQENLGEHQDTEVHTAQLQAMAKELEGSPTVTSETFLAIGRLTELFERRRLAARSLFAERFASYDTKTTAQALDDMLEAAREQ
ncbi:MAG: CHAD domain-containing protein [Acidimicrobiales bacterium]